VPGRGGDPRRHQRAAAALSTRLQNEIEPLLTPGPQQPGLRAADRGAVATQLGASRGASSFLSLVSPQRPGQRIPATPAAPTPNPSPHPPTRRVSGFRPRRPHPSHQLTGGKGRGPPLPKKKKKKPSPGARWGRPTWPSNWLSRTLQPSQSPQTRAAERGVARGGGGGGGVVAALLDAAACRKTRGGGLSAILGYSTARSSRSAPPPQLAACTLLR